MDQIPTHPEDRTPLIARRLDWPRSRSTSVRGAGPFMSHG